MRPSTVGLVRAALVEVLTAAPTLAGVSVTIGRPRPQPPRRGILILGAVGTVEPGPGGSTRQRDENYTVRLRAYSSLRNSTDQQSVGEDAQALRDAAELVLRTQAGEDLGLNVDGVLWAAVLGDFELVEPDDEVTLARASEATFDFRVTVRARV